MNKNTQNDKKQHRINLGVYTNLCSKLQANLYLQGIRMKNEVMEDYSLTCIRLVDIVYEHRSFLHYPVKAPNCKVQLHGLWAACGFPPCSGASFLRAGYSITQVSMSSPPRELTLSFKKNPTPLSWGKPPYISLLIGQKGGVPQRAMQSKSLTPELWITRWRRFSINYRGTLRRLTWEAGC